MNKVIKIKNQRSIDQVVTDSSIKFTNYFKQRTANQYYTDLEIQPPLFC